MYLPSQACALGQLRTTRGIIDRSALKELETDQPEVLLALVLNDISRGRSVGQQGKASFAVHEHAMPTPPLKCQDLLPPAYPHVCSKLSYLQ